MSDPVAQIKSWLIDHQTQMLEDFQSILRIPSVQEDPSPGAPFGKANRQALDLALSWCEEAGMTSKNLEGYVGYGEFGTGDKMIMTLGHLDVVPVGPGWKHEPFGAEIDGGYVYARGSSDDKGATVAMLYAAKALKEVVGDPGVRVRSVFGCNEESGFVCIEHYMKTEEAPTLGVAPDAMWPCVHAEKGISDFVVDVTLPQGDMSLLSIEGGQRPNIVIDSCKARVAFSQGFLAEAQAKVSDNWDKNLSLKWEGNTLEIEAAGKAAHGSTPFMGDNAANRILRFLMEISPTAQHNTYKDLYYLGHIGGHGIGISMSDTPSGPLTCNLGIVKTSGGKAEFTLNVRYPVTVSGDNLKSLCLAKLESLSGDFHLKSMGDSKPLYFPIDHPLVQAVTEIYQAETDTTTPPQTMGGGTYARAVPNCIAIGAGWEGDGPAHETDERMKIEHLNKMALIYGHILYRMVTIAKESS